MNGLQLAMIATLVAYAATGPSVLRFTMDREKVQAQPFNYSNCLPPDREEVVIKNLSFAPSPLVLPGPLTVAFSVDFQDDVGPPVQTDVYLAKRVGSVWVKIPCIDNIGSCHYDDLCQLLDMIGSCPPEFVENNVPCHCPFQKNTYTLPTTTFDVGISIFPAGDYHGQANLTSNGKSVGCYEIFFSFA